MTLELLYIPGCPHHDEALDLIHKVLSERSLTPEFSETIISNYDQAKQHCFPGSPTFRVNGRDIENVPADYLRVGLACRTYLVEGLRKGIPPRAWLERALCEAQVCEEEYR
jgi:hypothetical protein